MDEVWSPMKSNQSIAIRFVLAMVVVACVFNNCVFIDAYSSFSSPYSKLRAVSPRRKSSLTPRVLSFQSRVADVATMHHPPSTMFSVYSSEGDNGNDVFEMNFDGVSNQQHNSNYINHHHSHNQQQQQQQPLVGGKEQIIEAEQLQGNDKKAAIEFFLKNAHNSDGKAFGSMHLSDKFDLMNAIRSRASEMGVREMMESLWTVRMLKVPDEGRSLEQALTVTLTFAILDSLNDLNGSFDPSALSDKAVSAFLMSLCDVNSVTWSALQPSSRVRILHLVEHSVFAGADAFHVIDTIWSLGKLGMSILTLEKSFGDNVMRALLSIGHPIRNIDTLILGLSRMGFRWVDFPPEVKERLVEGIAAGRWTPYRIGIVFNSLGRMEINWPSLSDAARNNLMHGSAEHIINMNIQAFSNTIMGMGNCGVQWNRMPHDLQRALMTRLEQLDASHFGSLALCVQGLSKMRVRWMDMSPGARARIENNAMHLPCDRGLAISNLLYGLGQMIHYYYGHLSPALKHVLVTKFSSCLHNMVPKELITGFVGLSNAGITVHDFPMDAWLNAERMCFSGMWTARSQHPGLSPEALSEEYVVDGLRAMGVRGFSSLLTSWSDMGLRWFGETASNSQSEDDESGSQSETPQVNKIHVIDERMCTDILKVFDGRAFNMTAPQYSNMVYCVAKLGANVKTLPSSLVQSILDGLTWSTPQLIPAELSLNVWSLCRLGFQWSDIKNNHPDLYQALVLALTQHGAGMGAQSCAAVIYSLGKMGCKYQELDAGVQDALNNALSRNTKSFRSRDCSNTVKGLVLMGCTFDDLIPAARASILDNVALNAPVMYENALCRVIGELCKDMKVPFAAMPKHLQNEVASKLMTQYKKCQRGAVIAMLEGLAVGDQWSLLPQALQYSLNSMLQACLPPDLENGDAMERQNQQSQSNTPVAPVYHPSQPANSKAISTPPSGLSGSVVTASTAAASTTTRQHKVFVSDSHTPLSASDSHSIIMSLSKMRVEWKALFSTVKFALLNSVKQIMTAATPGPAAISGAGAGAGAGPGAGADENVHDLVLDILEGWTRMGIVWPNMKRNVESMVHFLTSAETGKNLSLAETLRIVRSLRAMSFQYGEMSADSCQSIAAAIARHLSAMTPDLQMEMAASLSTLNINFGLVSADVVSVLSEVYLKVLVTRAERDVVLDAVSLIVLGSLGDLKSRVSPTEFDTLMSIGASVLSHLESVDVKPVALSESQIVDTSVDSTTVSTTTVPAALAQLNQSETQDIASTEAVTASVPNPGSGSGPAPAVKVGKAAAPSVSSTPHKVYGSSRYQVASAPPVMPATATLLAETAAAAAEEMAAAALKKDRLSPSVIFQGTKLMAGMFAQLGMEDRWIALQDSTRKGFIAQVLKAN